MASFTAEYIKSEQEHIEALEKRIEQHKNAIAHAQEMERERTKHQFIDPEEKPKFTSEKLLVTQSYYASEPEIYMILPSGHEDRWIFIEEDPSEIGVDLLTAEEIRDRLGFDFIADIAHLFPIEETRP